VNAFRTWWCGDTEVTGDENTARLAWDAALLHIYTQAIRCGQATVQVTQTKGEYFVTISQLDRMCMRSKSDSGAEPPTKEKP
jgi:hypothetical protein